MLSEHTSTVFSKQFLNGLVSHILNNNITDSTKNYVNFCRADDIKVYFPDPSVSSKDAIKFQNAVNFSTLSKVRM